MQLGIALASIKSRFIYILVGLFANITKELIIFERFEFLFFPYVRVSYLKWRSVINILIN